MSMVKDKNNFGNIIATIAVAVGILFATMLNRQINSLDTRLRAVEVRVAEIATVLGIERAGPAGGIAGPLTGPQEDYPAQAGR